MKHYDWAKCDVCGRFISEDDLINGLAKRIMITPDSDISYESWETLCKVHTTKVGIITPLIGKWISQCTVCGKQYENGCGSTECCGALQEIISHSP